MLRWYAWATLAISVSKIVAAIFNSRNVPLRATPYTCSISGVAVGVFVRVGVAVFVAVDVMVGVLVSVAVADGVGLLVLVGKGYQWVPRLLWV